MSPEEMRTVMLCQREFDAAITEACINAGRAQLAPLFIRNGYTYRDVARLLKAPTEEHDGPIAAMLGDMGGLNVFGRLSVDRALIKIV